MIQNKSSSDEKSSPRLSIDQGNNKNTFNLLKTNKETIWLHNEQTLLASTSLDDNIHDSGHLNHEHEIICNDNTNNTVAEAKIKASETWRKLRTVITTGDESNANKQHRKSFKDDYINAYISSDSKAYDNTTAEGQNYDDYEELILALLSDPTIPSPPELIGTVLSDTPILTINENQVEPKGDVHAVSSDPSSTTTDHTHTSPPSSSAAPAEVISDTDIHNKTSDQINNTDVSTSSSTTSNPTPIPTNQQPPHTTLPTDQHNTTNTTNTTVTETKNPLFWYDEFHTRKHNNILLINKIPQNVLHIYNTQLHNILIKQKLQSLEIIKQKEINLLYKEYSLTQKLLEHSRTIDSKLKIEKEKMSINNMQYNNNIRQQYIQLKNDIYTYIKSYHISMREAFGEVVSGDQNSLTRKFFLHNRDTPQPVEVRVCVCIYKCICM